MFADPTKMMMMMAMVMMMVLMVMIMAMVIMMKMFLCILLGIIMITELDLIRILFHENLITKPGHYV